ncbi:MAG: hypothetical protein ACJAVM_002605 [Sulfitobacter sp.]|jgi:hypothetical protein
MTGTNGAYATRSIAIAAAQRLEKLIKLTVDDDFLHDTLTAAKQVISHAGLLAAVPAQSGAHPLILDRSTDSIMHH